MKLLLALDGSANSDTALERVVSRPWPDGTECHVITVNATLASKIPAVKLPGWGNIATAAHQALDVDLRELLSESVEKLNQKFGPAKVSSALMEGAVKDGILETATTRGTDLIVMGSPGSEGVNESGSGGLTRGVIGQAPCSVLVVRPISAASVQKKVEKGQEPEVESRFLVAVNDSTNSQAVIEMTMSSPWPKQSTFQVLTVAEPVRLPAHARFFKAKEIQELSEKASEARRQEAQDLSEKAARKLETKLGDEKVTFHALEGNARSLILQIAQDWPADTILMGAEDENRTSGEFFFGSTADAVLTRSNCSVQFIRASKAASKA